MFRTRWGQFDTIRAGARAMATCAWCKHFRAIEESRNWASAGSINSDCHGLISSRLARIEAEISYCIAGDAEAVLGPLATSSLSEVRR